MVHVRRGEAQAHLLVRMTTDDPVPPGWESHPVGLEELALAYLREPDAAVLPGPIRCLGVEGSEATRLTAMTTLTAPFRREEEDGSLRPVPWRRMAWVTWRQHRVALIGMAGGIGRDRGVHVDGRPAASSRLRRRNSPATLPGSMLASS